MQQRDLNALHELVGSAVPRVRDDHEKIGAGALKACSLSMDVERALVPEVAVYVVDALREIHGVDDDLRAVLAAEPVAHRLVGGLVVLGSHKFSRRTCEAYCQHFS